MIGMKLITIAAIVITGRMLVSLLREERRYCQQCLLGRSEPAALAPDALPSHVPLFDGDQIRDLIASRIATLGGSQPIL